MHTNNDVPILFNALAFVLSIPAYAWLRLVDVFQDNMQCITIEVNALWLNDSRLNLLQ